MPLPAVVLVVSGGHTSLYPSQRPARTSCSAARATMRRARRTTRWRSCSGSDIPAGRSIDRLAGAGQRPRGRVSEDAADARRSQRAAPARPARFQLQRPEDVGAATRHRAARGARAAADEPAARSRRSRDICASFQRVVVETLLDRLFDAARWYWRAQRRHRRRRVGEQPAARGGARARRGARAAGVHSEPGALDRQCGDDCRRRPARLSRRRHAAGLNADASLALERSTRPGLERLMTGHDHERHRPTISGSTRRSGRSSSASPTRSRRSSRRAA